jgi:hypothetical protein
MRYWEIIVEAYIEQGHYGGWITPNGEVHYVSVESHATWAGDHYGGIIEAFRHGCVRFVTSRSLSVEGKRAALQAQYPIWSRAALELGEVWIDVVGDDVSASGHYRFSLPQDRRRMAEQFGPGAQLKQAG